MKGYLSLVIVVDILIWEPENISWGTFCSKISWKSYPFCLDRWKCLVGHCHLPLPVGQV